ncbi:MAG: DNA repair protein RadA [Flavobacteriales bacterium]|nr:DNA repair protein RadA [Flavobacteriales bacterium]
MAAKTKTVFVCKNCGMDYPKWLGQCPSCHQWNTLVEKAISTATEQNVPAWSFSKEGSATGAIPLNIREVEFSQQDRIDTSDTEFNRILGGGLVSGSITLLGGEPGIGKSTLMLQLALRAKGLRTLYVSGEESPQQIKMRAERIGITNDECYVLSETRTDAIFSHIKEVKPAMVVVDSIQTLTTGAVEASAGSVSQIRECAGELLRYAKQSGVPVILIGHITKDGTLAGPKILEHMVDTVLQFEGDRNHIYRIVRAIKNRFGSTDEIGIYSMNGGGLTVVDNPSSALISQHNSQLSGNSIAVTLEGMRPIMIEVQALVSSAVYGTPQRSTTGYDIKRLNMLLAVLEKRVGFHLGSKDVFLNITGGVRVDDPALDLAVVASVLSSNEDIAIGEKTCFAAEVGLSGEIRPVTRIEQRVSEAQKLGFNIIFISKYNKIVPQNYPGIRVMPIERIEQLVKFCFA